MPRPPAPTRELADLVRLLGEQNVCTLIRTFLREYPTLVRQLDQGDRTTRHRMAHSLKSNARVIGARELSDKMAGLEQRLADETGADLEPAEIAAVAAEFEAMAKVLRAYVGDA